MPDFSCNILLILLTLKYISSFASKRPKAYSEPSQTSKTVLFKDPIAGEI